MKFVWLSHNYVILKAVVHTNIQKSEIVEFLVIVSIAVEDIVNLIQISSENNPINIYLYVFKPVSCNFISL